MLCGNDLWKCNLGYVVCLSLSLVLDGGRVNYRFFGSDKNFRLTASVEKSNIELYNIESRTMLEFQSTII